MDTITDTKQDRQSRLEALGLTSAASKQRELRELKRKMTIAYEFYRYVKPENFSEFNEALRKKSEKETERYWQYDKLVFVPLSLYTEEPPEEVLTALEAAIERKCFDTFEIAKIESVKKMKDPILFGVITGCPDKFYIAQWEDDVKIEDILKENEG